MKTLNWFILIMFVASLGALPALAGDRTYEAVQITPPNINGDLSDWPADLATEEVTILGSFVNPASPADLTAHFMAGYDVAENRLYVAVMLTDDATYAVLPVADGGSWKNDRVEIYIDGDNSKSDTGYTFETAQQYAIYGPAEQAVQLAGGEKLLNNVGEYPADKDDFVAAVKRTGTETIYEVALVIYRTYDADMITLEPGVNIGFDMAVVDNDDGNDDHASFLMWTEGGGKYKDETVFGTMTLSPIVAVNPAGKLATTWSNLKSK